MLSLFPDPIQIWVSISSSVLFHLSILMPLWCLPFSVTWPVQWPLNLNLCPSLGAHVIRMAIMSSPAYSPALTLLSYPWRAYSSLNCTVPVLLLSCHPILPRPTYMLQTQVPLVLGQLFQIYPWLFSQHSFVTLLHPSVSRGRTETNFQLSMQ